MLFFFFFFFFWGRLWECKTNNLQNERLKIHLLAFLVCARSFLEITCLFFLKFIIFVLSSLCLLLTRTLLAGASSYCSGCGAPVSSASYLHTPRSAFVGPPLSTVFDQCHGSQRDSWTTPCVCLLINHGFCDLRRCPPGMSAPRIKPFSGCVTVQWCARLPAVKSAPANHRHSVTFSPSLSDRKLLIRTTYSLPFIHNVFFYEQKISTAEIYSPTLFFLQPHLSPCTLGVQYISASSRAPRGKCGKHRV